MLGRLLTVEISKRNQAKSESADHRCYPVAGAQLLHGIAKMEFDGFFRNSKDFADLPIGLTLLAPP